jgi:hypothetical protein
MDIPDPRTEAALLAAMPEDPAAFTLLASAVQPAASSAPASPPAATGPPATHVA